MKIDGVAYRSIWVDRADGWAVHIIDQTRLPWALEILRLTGVDQAAHAIRAMQTRGAPLIGALAAYGLCLALRADASTEAMERDATLLAATRPTAVNLRWALDRMLTRLRNTRPDERVAVAYAEAAAIADEDVAQCEAIGRHGLPLIEAAAARKQGGRVNVLTHCNAGWLATVDWGTALAPIYTAHNAGLDLHVWVDETRPRNQGAALTAWELGKHGVPHTVVADNAGGHLMQHGDVDLAIVGADRVTRAGDVANKIGTYLKALAARDNDVPFWVGGAVVHHRLDAVGRGGRDPDRGTQRRGGHRRDRAGGGRAGHDGAGGAGWEWRGQSGVRRDAGAVGDRIDHRTGALRREHRRAAWVVSGARCMRLVRVGSSASKQNHHKGTKAQRFNELRAFVPLW